MWPQGSTPICVERLNCLNASPVNLPTTPAPGAEIDVTVQLTAPKQPGMYQSYFRLLDPTGKKFGQRIRCQIHVVDAQGK